MQVEQEANTTPRIDLEAIAAKEDVLEEQIRLDVLDTPGVSRKENAKAKLIELREQRDAGEITKAEYKQKKAELKAEHLGQLAAEELNSVLLSPKDTPAKEVHGCKHVCSTDATVPSSPAKYD